MRTARTIIVAIGRFAWWYWRVVKWAEEGQPLP